MKKTILKGLCVAALLSAGGLSLASCGGGSSSSSGDITFWHTMGQENQATLNNIIEKFNKQEGHADIKIKHSSQGGYEDIYNKLIKAIPAKTTPVMAFCYPDHVADYINAGAVVNLDDLIKETYTSTGKDKSAADYNVEDDVNDFITPFLKEGQEYAKEGTYSMPFSKSTEVMFYNASYLKKNGFVDKDGKAIVPTKWENEADPTDLTALINLCRAIKAKDPSITPLGYDSDDNLFITMCKQLNIPYTSIKDGKGSFDFDNPQSRAMVEKVKGWYDEGLIKTKGTIEGNSYTSTLFTKQKLIFSIGSTGGTKYNKPAQDADGNFEFAAEVAPVPGQLTKNCISQGPSICFFKNAKISEEQTKTAFEFYKFLTNPENSAAYSILTGYEPVRSSSYETDIYKAHLNAEVQTIFTKVANITTTLQDDYFTSPAFKGSATARIQAGGILTQYLLGTKTLDKAYSDAMTNCQLAAI